MNPTKLAMTRPMGVAASLRDEPLDATSVLGKRVLLVGEEEALRTTNGQWCFLNSLRLLARVCGPLFLALPRNLGSFEQEVRDLASSVYTQGSVSLTYADSVNVAEFSAILNVGTTSRGDLPWTSVTSSGWVIRASSKGQPLPSSHTDHENPIGALLAASIGATEVFKRIYEVPETSAPLLDITEFSLFDLDSAQDSGPPLPVGISLPNTLIVGAGAIGNGICLLLAQLGWHGRVHVVDNQVFGEENLGTCTLLDDQTWIGASKAEELSAWLKAHSNLVVTGEQAEIGVARGQSSIRGMSPELVLTALDDVKARHDSQLLWPSALVDGGINAIGAAVVTHRLDRSGACLRCAFELPPINLERLQANASGLDVDSLQDLDSPLTEEDIAHADEAKRPWLRKMLEQGKTRCATVGIAAADRLGIAEKAAFKPSVPFVATAAAALVMAEAIKTIIFPEARFTHRFQIESLFRGPEASISTFRAADDQCLCVTARETIEQLQRTRAVGASARP